MKELTIEQKAKAYDEVIERAVSLLSGNQVGNAWIYKLVPELKESEDEKIRKAIKMHFEIDSHLSYSGINKKNILDWIEKQSNKNEEILILKDQIESLHAAIKAVKETYRIKLEKQGNNMGISEATKQELEDNLNKALEKETPESLNEFLDKQGEQKSAWSEEDKKMARFVGNAITADDASTYLKDKGIEVTDAHIWLDELKDRIQPQNLTVNDEELNQAKKEAHNDALNKIEYHSGEPTFDDGWSAAIWYLKKRNILQSKTIWKPSDEQMKALSYCIKYHIDNDGVYGRQVVKLYQDLLKLKGLKK